MGTQIRSYNWDWGIISQNLPFLERGILVTIGLTFIVCIFATAIAIPLSLLLRSKNKAVRVLSLVFTEFWRATPIIVLLVWVHYVAPVMVGLSLSPFWSAAVAFTLNLAAFLADIFRGNVQAIPIGHVEAALALGYNNIQVKLRVIVQEVFRRSWPAMFSFYVGTFKLTTLAAIIGAQEIFFTIRIINANSPHPLELYTALAIFFVIVIAPLGGLSRLLETNRWFALFPKSNHD